MDSFFGLTLSLIKRIKKNHLLNVVSCVFGLLFVTACQHTSKHSIQSPSTPEEQSLLRVARSMKESKNYKTSYNFYEDILTKNPKNLEAHLGLIDLALLNKTPQDAYKQYQLAERHIGEHLELDYSLVKIYLALEDRNSAHALAKKLVQKNPKDAKAYRLLGVTFDASSNHQKAQEAYQKSLELDPHNIKTKSNLGLSYVFSKQPQKAVEILKPVALSPDATEKDRHNYAISLILTQDIEQAERILAQDLSHSQAQDFIQFVQESSNELL